MAKGHGVHKWVILDPLKSLDKMAFDPSPPDMTPSQMVYTH